jgi:hypothetical protein
MSRSNRSRGGTGRVWNAAFLLAVAVGLLCANVQWGLQRWTAAALTVAVMASLVAAAMLADGGVRAIPKMAASGLVAGFVGSAAAALVTTFDVLGLLVVLVLVATSPAVHVGVRVAWRTLFAAPVPGSSRSQQQAGDQARHVPRAPRASVVQPSLAGIADLDDADLCRAWRESFAQLRSARSSTARLDVVERRQRYLDELQLRHPDGMASWLASGADAAGDPRPYLDEPPAQQR